MSVIGNPITLGGGNNSKDQTTNGILANANIYVSQGRYVKSGGGNTAFFYMKNPNSFSALDVNWSQPFEIFATFKFISVGSINTLCGSATSNKYFYTPSIELQANGNSIWAGFSTNGSSWTKDISFNINWQTDLWYTLKYEWDGSTFTVTVNDGTQDHTSSVSQTTGHYHNASQLMCFFNIAYRTSSWGDDIILDLYNTYIKSNGTMVWGHKEKHPTYE